MAREITSSAVFTAYITSKAHEYAAEAEHQEGPTYWKNFFESDEAVIDDFIMYLQNIRNKSGGG